MPADKREKLRKDPLFAIGFSLALLWVLAAMLGPMLAPFDPWEMSFTPFSSPSNAHLMGINDGGQDAFSGFLYAVRNSLIFGCITSGRRPSCLRCSWAG
jgi:ABC-type dipeptide/oligopeptide/nickel transport system permease subunit